MLLSDIEYMHYLSTWTVTPCHKQPSTFIPRLPASVIGDIAIDSTDSFLELQAGALQPDSCGVQQGRADAVSPGKVGRGEGGAGSQGAADHNHPELSHQTNETKCHQRVGVVASSDPSNLHDFSSLPLRFLVRCDTQHFTEYLFAHSNILKKHWKKGVTVMREEVQ